MLAITNRMASRSVTGIRVTRSLIRMNVDPQAAAALGHVEALNALLDAGANASTVSAQGATAREIAIAEGKTESVNALDARHPL